jgi:hypothetical protein
MKTAKWFEKYYKMALYKKDVLYHNQTESSDSAKHGALHEFKLSLIIPSNPQLCSSNTPNSQ